MHSQKLPNNLQKQLQKRLHTQTIAKQITFVTAGNAASNCNLTFLRRHQTTCALTAIAAGAGGKRLLQCLQTLFLLVHMFSV